MSSTLIKVGDSLPPAHLWVMKLGNNTKVPIQELCAHKKVVFVGLPGAFTPVCHGAHVPGYIALFEQFKAKGIDTINIISVNDAFVMDAWRKALNATEEMNFCGDGNAEFSLATGLSQDLSVVGMGRRALRYALVADRGVVTHLFLEENPVRAQVSAAENVLAHL